MRNTYWDIIFFLGFRSNELRSPFFNDVSVCLLELWSEILRFQIYGG